MFKKLWTWLKQTRQRDPTIEIIRDEPTTGRDTAGVGRLIQRGLKIAVLIGLVIVLINVLVPFRVVPAGHRGVMTTFGKVDNVVLGEGLHFRIPLVQEIHLVTVQIQKGEGSGEAASKDLQQVSSTVAINYHLAPNEVPRVFQAIGSVEEVGTRIITPAVSESVKAATAQYTAEELITKRAAVRENIRQELAQRLRKYGIIVDEFSIVNFTFSKSFNDAIEAKTTAEQLKLKAERDLQRIRVEAEQKLAQARAEAESLALQKQQVSAELIRLREVETQREAIRKWDGHLPQVTAGTPFINITPTK